jgi:hypothetical protein
MKREMSKRRQKLRPAAKVSRDIISPVLNGVSARRGKETAKIDSSYTLFELHHVSLADTRSVEQKSLV